MPSPNASPRSNAELRSPTPTTNKEKLNERIAKLAGGVAVIKVGGPHPETATAGHRQAAH